jgi:hypothetical protein
MSIVRTTRFHIDPANVEEAMNRRAAVISAVRAAYPGLTEARLTRLEDGTWADSWRWASREAMETALAGAPTLPEAGAAFAIVTDATVEVAELVDER